MHNGNMRGKRKTGTEGIFEAITTENCLKLRSDTKPLTQESQKIVAGSFKNK